jgi:hypothetical protein
MEFSFWYDETYTYKGYITADSEEEARKVIEQVQLGEISINDLPSFQCKDKGYFLEIDPGTLEDLND